MADAQAAVRAALDEYAATSSRDKGWTVGLRRFYDAKLGGMRGPLTYVQLGVGAMLLLMCVSLAVLLRARTASATTSSSGVLTKSLLVAFAGGAIGALVTALALPGLLEITPNALPRLADVAFDTSAVVFAVLLCIVTGLVIGIVPALLASRGKALAYGWRGRLTAFGVVVLLAVQTALAFVLLAAAGLAIRAHGDLEGRDLRVDPSGLLAFDVHLPRSPYVTPDVARAGSIELAEYSPAGAAVYDRIRAALQTAPGVVQAAAVGTPSRQYPVQVSGRANARQPGIPRVTRTTSTMGIASSADGFRRPIVAPWRCCERNNGQTAWPDGNAVGQRRRDVSSR
jgi:hypothetical protein